MLVAIRTTLIKTNFSRPVYIWTYVKGEKLSKYHRQEGQHCTTLADATAPERERERKCFI